MPSPLGFIYIQLHSVIHIKWMQLNPIGKCFMFHMPNFGWLLKSNYGQFYLIQKKKKKTIFMKKLNLILRQIFDF